MELTVNKKDNINIIGISGKLDTNTWPELEEKLIPIIDSGEKNILIDCSYMDYISSAGLRVLLIAAKKLRAGNGKIVIAAMKAPIRSIFDIAGFTSIFPVSETLSDGIEYLKKEGQ